MSVRRLIAGSPCLQCGTAQALASPLRLRTLALRALPSSAPLALAFALAAASPSNPQSWDSCAYLGKRPTNGIDSLGGTPRSEHWTGWRAVILLRTPGVGGAIRHLVQLRSGVRCGAASSRLME